MSTRARELAWRNRVLDRVAVRMGKREGRSENGGRERRRVRAGDDREVGLERKGGRRRRRSRISGGGAWDVVDVCV